nr:hypothetical protein L203_03634 [Cryptococcus depauperatus CBS 7841]
MRDYLTSTKSMPSSDCQLATIQNAILANNNPEPRTQNPEPRTQNPEPRTQNPEPRTRNLSEISPPTRVEDSRVQAVTLPVTHPKSQKYISRLITWLGRSQRPW